MGTRLQRGIRVGSFRGRLTASVPKSAESERIPLDRSIFGFDNRVDLRQRLPIGIANIRSSSKVSRRRFDGHQSSLAATVRVRIFASAYSALVTHVSAGAAGIAFGCCLLFRRLDQLEHV